MQYKLLPFSFSRISGKEVLVNELGDMIIAPVGSVYALANHLPIENDLYKSLVSNFFIYEGDVPEIMDIYASRLKTKKGFLEYGPSLHIFVLTLRCNQNCIYCQASSRSADNQNCSMSVETMDAAVRMMFCSSSPDLTMEFQGGEPSLEIELIEHAILLAEEINKESCKNITYVLCTNCVDMNDKVLTICQKYHILISTSLDGPEFIHNKNRGKSNSYSNVISGISKARDVLGKDQVSALMTASKFSVDYPLEIIDEYVKLGFESIFLRALNPYGLAAKNDNWVIYTDKFISFYKKAFEHIIELNKNGIFFIEEFARIILRKILTPFTTGFVDLQSPAGVINSVLVYNYDGYVYASDESRMLAEFNDYTFRLGNVTDAYEDIVWSTRAKSIAKIWANECLAGCSDCGVKAYCGADPVRNYSTQHDEYGYRPKSMLCRKNKQIIEYIISLIVERPEEVLPIFKRWIA